MKNSLMSFAEANRSRGGRTPAQDRDAGCETDHEARQDGRPLYRPISHFTVPERRSSRFARSASARYTLPSAMIASSSRRASARWPARA
jgi:hypothetical protein